MRWRLTLPCSIPYNVVVCTHTQDTKRAFEKNVSRAHSQRSVSRQALQLGRAWSGAGAYLMRSRSFIGGAMAVTQHAPGAALSSHHTLHSTPPTDRYPHTSGRHFQTFGRGSFDLLLLEFEQTHFGPQGEAPSSRFHKVAMDRIMRRAIAGQFFFLNHLRR